VKEIGSDAAFVAAAIAAICRIDPFPSNSGRDRLITNRLEGYGMKRREFIAGLGSAVAWPLASRASADGTPQKVVLYEGNPGTA
jgi:hypothetical protein